MLPRERFGPDELLLWLVESQLRNEQARRSHERRSRREGGWSRHPESVVVVLRGNAHVLGEQALNPTYFDLGEHTNGCAAHTGE